MSNRTVLLATLRSKNPEPMGIDTSNPEVQLLKLAVCLFFGRTKNTAAKLRLLRQLCRFGGLVPATPQQLGCKFVWKFRYPLSPKQMRERWARDFKAVLPADGIVIYFYTKKSQFGFDLKVREVPIAFEVRFSGGSPSWR